MLKFYFVIFLEGFVVLSTELLLIRQFVPFVGSGTEVVSIVISSVLLPLAIGYEYGGKFVAKNKLDIIHKLTSNLLVSLWFLLFGLSYLIHETFFQTMYAIGIKSNILQVAILCLTFIVYPVYLLGQTVPLTVNFLKKEKISKITGNILFLSTAGSFVGSIFTTLILMMMIGVSNTVLVVLAMIVVMIFILNKNILSVVNYFSVLGLIIAIGLNIIVSEYFNVVSDNAYNQIVIDRGQQYVDFKINRSSSSRITSNPELKYDYVKAIEKLIAENENIKKEILIIGAGGFSIGLEDDHNNYTYVDIDPDMLKVSEKHFLGKKLGQNKEFIAKSARAFLNQSSEKFDVILIDVYSHSLSVPIETTSQQFYKKVKNNLAPNGIVIANIIASPNFKDDFSIRIHNTFASVFWPFNRVIINSNSENEVANIIYTYKHFSANVDSSIYTDDKNTYSMDKK